MDSKRPNIIFIMLDTARADYLSAYGGGLELPGFDRLARRGTVYLNAISPGTYTASSHVSLFTGRRVASISQLMEDRLRNADRNTDPFLVKSRLIREGEPTLASKLRGLGYNTLLFSSNPLVTRYTGIAEGFSSVEYTDAVAIASRKKMKNLGVRAPLALVGSDAARKRLLELSYLVSRMMPRNRLDRLYLSLRARLNRVYAREAGSYSLDMGAAPMNKIVLSRSKKAAEAGPNFLFINYMEAHEGYPTNLVAKEYVEQDKWLYLSGILDACDAVRDIKAARDLRLAYLDSQIAALLSKLRSSGLLDNSVLILSGDHGQGFMEHGQMYHSMFPYGEIVRVPLIAARFVNGRQVSTRERISVPVSLTSLHSSIMEIGHGRRDEVDGSMTSSDYVFSDHTGITEVWDAYLLKLIRSRSKSADAIYRAKIRQNAFATAVYKGRYKLLHFRNGQRRDELYDIGDDPGELQDISGEKRQVARELTAAAMRK